jgi:hypothetical protein
MFAIKWGILVGILEWDSGIPTYGSSTMVLNAVLSLLLFVFANWYIVSGPPIPDYVLLAIKTSSIIRIVITWYTISCGIYLALYSSTGIPLPPLGRKWVPWS